MNRHFDLPSPWTGLARNDPPPAEPTFGSRLRRAREMAGLGHRELARLIDVESSNIGRWESNEVRPRFDAILKLCKVLGVSPNELMGWPE